jgi:hypothetical protein
MLWITDHAVLEGRHWSALGKEFGETLQITTSGSDFLIFHVHTAEAKPPRKGLRPLVQLWNSIPLELRFV